MLKKEVVPVMQQAKVRGYVVTEYSTAGTWGRTIPAIFYDTYETLGKGHPFQVALGEDGARRLEAKFAGIHPQGPAVHDAVPGRI